MSADMGEAWDTFRVYMAKAAPIKLGEEDGADYIAAIDSAWNSGGVEAVTAFLESSRTVAGFDEDMAALWTQATGAEVRREQEAATYGAGAYVDAVVEDATRVAQAAASLGEGVISAAEGAGSALKAGGDAAKGSPFSAALIGGVLLAVVVVGGGYVVGRVYRVW